MVGVCVVGVLVGVVIILLTLQVHAQGVCQFDLDAVPSGHNQPLLVDASRRKLVYPEQYGETRLVMLRSRRRYLVSCPGKSNALEFTDNLTAELSCRSGELVLTDNSRRISQKVRWEELGCHKRPRASQVKINSSRRCGRGGSQHAIGWILNEGVFLPQISVCFNTTTEATMFTRHILYGRNIDAKTVEPSRPSFKSGNLFDVDVRSAYRKKSQLQVATLTLRSREYLTGQGQRYLARGHLSPDSDFIYAAEQDATYFYVNVAPQWQAFNNGNWKRLEFSVRELADTRDLTLEVWTGTHGTLQLPDLDNNPVDLYLGQVEGKKVLPVPALIWKVIRDIRSRRAVAIVGVNDVTGEGMANDRSLFESPCSDLCHELTWIDWDTSDLRRGWTFCCHVSDLVGIIPNLPDLGSVSLLR